MKANEVRKMSAEELEKQLTSLKKDLFYLRMQHATNQLDNPVKISQVKKDIARVKTIIRERQLEQRGGKLNERDLNIFQKDQGRQSRIRQNG